MANKLVIVESPAKAKTINRILGKEYTVKSSVGHVRDLPVNRLGVDVDHDFAPQYVVMKGKKTVIGELKSAARDVEAVYLAPDPDREGEAIAWHLQEVLQQKDDKRRFLRVQYNEITPGAVKAAFDKPGEIDMNRVNAQQARRVLDRIVGYSVSQLLWRRIRRGLSAGRVQSVALRLVCEREEEIERFVPEEYWVFGARVRKLVVPLDPFRLKLLRIDGEKAQIGSKARADAVRADLEGRAFRVSGLKSRTVTRRASPPFITSSLQQAASSAFNFSPKRTMSIAQSLYEGVNMGQGPVGLITYMRTDSFSISRDAQNACRDFIVKTYGQDYYPEKPNVYRSRGSAQEAHEAIRPTDVTRTPDRVASKLGKPELKVYRLIWERFVASQMAKAVMEQRTAQVTVSPEQGRKTEYSFQASSTDVVFPGYMKVSGSDPSRKQPSEDTMEGDRLPPLVEGEPLECLELLSVRKETQPPPRYSEASLVRAMESNGIGRPSTYAQIVSTLQQRSYVERKERALAPTDLGREVKDLLVKDLDSLFNVRFTASMEDALDEVEAGKTEWTGMLGEFYGQFTEAMEQAKPPPADRDAVAALLTLLSGVNAWNEPVKRGKRTYSDEQFVASVREQFDEDSKPISVRQLQALARMAYKYRTQLDGVEAVLKNAGLEAVFEQARTEAPRESTNRKLELLGDVGLDESGRDFVNSLRGRVESGRCLSPAQLKALDGIVMAHAEKIPDFEQRRRELGLEHVEIAEDRESPVLLDALSHVTEWKPPVKRGKRVFDDAKFAESLRDHLSRKGHLSDRQRAALRKLVARYQQQVPNYADLAREHDLGRKPPKRESRTKDASV